VQCCKLRVFKVLCFGHTQAYNCFAARLVPCP